MCLFSEIGSEGAVKVALYFVLDSIRLTVCFGQFVLIYELFVVISGSHGGSVESFVVLYFEQSRSKFGVQCQHVRRHGSTICQIVCHQYGGLFEIDVLVQDAGFHHVRDHVNKTRLVLLLGHYGDVADQDALGELLGQMSEGPMLFVMSGQSLQFGLEVVGFDLFYQF